MSWVFCFAVLLTSANPAVAGTNGPVPIVINTWPWPNATARAWAAMHESPHAKPALDAVTAGCAVCEGQLAFAERDREALRRLQNCRTRFHRQFYCQPSVEASGWMLSQLTHAYLHNLHVNYGDLDEFMAATLAQKAFGTSPGAVEDVD